jgi:hypothetical protein
VEGASVEVDEVIDEVLSAEQADADSVEDEVAAGDDQADEIAETEACGPLNDVALGEQVGEDSGAAGNLVAAAGSLVTVAQLDAVPLFFARGVPARPQSFSIEPGFRDVLVQTIRSVRARTPASFGDLVRITTAGAFVDKPGMHGLGRAFDHDAWTFEHVDIRPIRHDHVAASRAQRQRYWALAAIMRSHSAFVLHGHFNADHEDHIHQDNGGSRPFTTSSPATVKLVQAVCNHIYSESPALDIDGGFGELSAGAVRRAMIKAGLAGDVFDPAQWRRFLRRSGRLGFRLSMHG